MIWMKSTAPIDWMKWRRVQKWAIRATVSPKLRYWQRSIGFILKSPIYRVDCSPRQKNWTDAYDYCEKHNMSLLSFETQEESQRIGDYIKQSGN